MPQLEHTEVIERRLWGAADTLRANSNYASNDYFIPVMGLSGPDPRLSPVPETVLATRKEENSKPRGSDPHLCLRSLEHPLELEHRLGAAPDRQFEDDV